MHILMHIFMHIFVHICLILMRILTHMVHINSNFDAYLPSLVGNAILSRLKTMPIFSQNVCMPYSGPLQDVGSPHWATDAAFISLWSISLSQNNMQWDGIGTLGPEVTTGESKPLLWSDR